MGEPFLGPDRGDDLPVRIERHAEDGLVALGDRMSELHDAATRRIAMVRRLQSGLPQLLDGHRRRGYVGIPEAQVDHVATRAPELALQLVDLGEEVWGEPVGAAVGVHATDASTRSRWSIAPPASQFAPSR